MTYTEAIERALSGDESGFNFLYNATKTDKYYLALKYVKDRETAEDVLQEAYLKAWKKLDTVEPEKFEAWFAQIVANTAKNVLEKKKHTALDLKVEVGEDEVPEDVYDMEVSSWENAPELAYTQKETAELVHEMLDGLPDEQRFVVLMHEIEGLSTKQIAEALECSEDTVKSRLRYGKLKLKAKAEELQKKGYKLYSISPTALLVLLVHSEQKSFAMDAQTQAALWKCADIILKDRRTTPAAAAAAGRTAFMTAKAGKLAVGIAAAVIAGGGAVAGIAIHNSNNSGIDTPESNGGYSIVEAYDSELTSSVTIEAETESVTETETYTETEAKTDTYTEEDTTVVYENDDGSDPFFNYDERFSSDIPEGYRECGEYNSVGLEHLARFTGEEIEPVDEDMTVDSVAGYAVLDALLYREKAARDADSLAAGVVYMRTPIDDNRLPNGTVVHVNECITVGAINLFGSPALGYTVTVYSVTYEGVTGYVIQNVFNGSPADVNPG